MSTPKNRTNCPLSVVHIVPGQPFGGAQRIAIDLATQQCHAGYDASLLFLGNGDEALRSAHAADVPAKATGRTLTRFFAPFRVSRSKDIVHLHVPPPWIALFLSRRSAKILHLHTGPVLQVHGFSLRSLLDTVGERFVIARSNHLIAISEWIRKSWSRAHAIENARTSVVFNGTELESQQVLHSGKRPFTVAIACRMSERRGVEEFLELALHLSGKHADIRFRVAGDGPRQSVYVDAAQAAGLGDAIAFDGFVTDMAEYWSSVDLAAYTPPIDAFGLRLVEPIAHGVPVVAYQNGSGSDEVIERCRGIVSVPYKDVDALAEEVLALALDPDRRVRMAREGFEDVARHFSLKAMMEGVEKVYESALQSKTITATN